MNFTACGALPLGPETGTWYRALQFQHLPTALQTSHTKHFPSRFNEGPTAVQPFEVFYAAQDHLVAMCEVQALLGSPYWPPGGSTGRRQPEPELGRTRRPCSVTASCSPNPTRRTGYASDLGAGVDR